MNAKLQIVATLSAKPSRADELRTALTEAVPKFRAEPGCDGYILLADRKRPGRFMTYETWADEAALEAHMHSPAMSALGLALHGLLDGQIEQDFLSVLVAA